jgi:hypothetical protein
VGTERTKSKAVTGVDPDLQSFADLANAIFDVVQSMGVPVDFGDLLLFLERRDVPFEVAKRAVWTLIQEDLVTFDRDGALVAK